VNGNKESARIIKTYTCRCGEINRFSFETDFNFTEIRIDACCQGCGKDISISVENHLAGNGNGNANGSSYSQNSYSNGYSNNSGSQSYNCGYNPDYSTPSSSILESPVSSNSYPVSSSPSPSSSSSDSSASSSPTIPDFNFDALTSAAVTESLAQAQTPTPALATPSYSESADINSLSSDIMQDAEQGVSEIAEPTPVPLATKVVSNPASTPAKRIIAESGKEEEEDLLSQEENMYGEEAAPDEKEAFIDLFGRL
jgi:hypothetical protein